jgi:catechol-2,3-dioxygenase
MTDRHPPAFTHVGVTVSDVDEAMAWYEDTLDFDVVVPPGTIHSDDGYRWRRLTDLLGTDLESVRVGHMTTGNQVGVEFFEFDATDGTTDSAPSDPGYFHVGVLHPEIGWLAQRIDDAGGDHYADIWEVGDARATYCHDPWDNRIEIYTQSHERLTVGGVTDG